MNLFLKKLHTGHVWTLYLSFRIPFIATWSHQFIRKYRKRPFNQYHTVSRKSGFHPYSSSSACKFCYWLSLLQFLHKFTSHFRNMAPNQQYFAIKRPVLPHLVIPSCSKTPGTAGRASAPSSPGRRSRKRKQRQKLQLDP